MNIELKKGSLSTAKVDMVVIGCFQKEEKEEKKKNTTTAATLEKDDQGLELDRIFDGALSRMLRDENFNGKEGKSRLIFTAGKIPARYVLLVGLGTKKEFSLSTLRLVAAIMTRKAEEISARSLALVVSSGNIVGLSAMKRVQALTEGLLQGLYRFETYRTAQPQTTKLESAFFFVSGSTASLQQSIQHGMSIGKSVCLARDLINMPSNDLTPLKLAAEAQKISHHEKLSCHVLKHEDMKKEKMEAFLAVAKGSSESPALIHLSYRPKKAKYHVALVGKAVTFDSGGISIKPSRNMHEMKSDMGGGAVVLATMQALAQLKPNVAVDGYIAAAENMPDARAVKPGDIVRARNGKTVEIINTDAEGRLLLADTLSYASDRKPDMMIDLATLTGGAVYALGEIYAALMGNDERLTNRLLKASELAGEKVWQLPLEKRYLKDLTKGPADLVNSGGSMAQTITAALFLSQFVGKTRWAHLDIAPCAWTNEETPLCSRGGTGSLVPTLISFILSL